MTVTREAATARARELIGAEAEPYPHHELDRDRDAGGYAFMAGTSFVIIGFHGGYVTSLLGFGDRTVDNIVAEWLEEERQRDRTPGESSFGPSQRLALEAVRMEVPVVAAAGGASPAVVDHAEYLAIFLRRAQAAGRDLVADLTSREHQLAPPEPGRRYTHPCPVCSTPTVHMDRYPRWLCPACSGRAADGAGRTVEGFNESMSGGLIVFYRDSPTGPQSEVAEEVMASGLVWVDGAPCSIVEGRFGGVVVQTIAD